MNPHNNDPKIIVALDFDNQNQALQLVEQLTASECKLKVGKELFTACGPDFVRRLIDLQFDVFLDLKFHDIPTTVKKAVKAAVDLGVWMVNVHALGGQAMMQAAKEGLDASAKGSNAHLIAVTVLTSTNQAALDELGFSTSVKNLVMQLGQSALASGLDGMVCSALEVEALRAEFGEKPLLVTPGIRPEGSATDDQKRIMTPKQAMLAGSSYLVVGRPVTMAENPLAALQAINESLRA